MKLTPPTTPAVLARDLGLSDKQLATMRVKAKTEPKLIARLQRLWLETRDEPRLLARRSQQGYTHTPHEGLNRGDEYGSELEAVPETYQNVLTLRAHSKTAERESDERAEQVARDQARRFSAQVRDLALRAARAGVDPALVFAPLQRRLSETEQEMKRAA